METKTKVLIGLGAVAAFLVLQRSVGGFVSGVLGQAFMGGKRTPWASLKLGTGSSTIGAGGCILVSLTTAFNRFNPGSPMTPDVANDILKSKGAFVGSNMRIDDGAAALGIDLQEDIRGASVAAMKAAIDKTLDAGGMALLRVAHGSVTAAGDHTVLITGRSGGGYTAADPALAKTIAIDSNLRSDAGSAWGAKKPYTGVQVQTLLNV